MIILRDKNTFQARKQSTFYTKMEQLSCFCTKIGQKKPPKYNIYQTQGI